jgi:outer membrane protein assembly factor BamB
MNTRPALLLLSLLATAASSAADWPRFRGPDGNGISKETGWFKEWPATGPKVFWEAKVGLGFSSFAVAEGKALITGNEADTDTLFCFDAVTGEVLWKKSYPCPLMPKYYQGGTNATPTVEQGRVYHLGKTGQMFCLQLSDGKVIWEKDILKEHGLALPEWGFAGSPIIVGDLICLNAGGAGLALNKSDGSLAWKSDASSAAYATAVPLEINGVPSLAILSHQDLVAVKLADGKEWWRHPFKSGYDTNSMDPIPWNGRLILSAHDQKAQLLDISSAEPKVEGTLGDTRVHMNAGVVLGDHLYQIHGSGGKPGDLRCIDLKTQKVVWKEVGLGVGALSAADGKLIVLGEKGELAIIAASPAGYEELARAQLLGPTCWTQPVLAHGRIYLRSGKGDVVCVSGGVVE